MERPEEALFSKGVMEDHRGSAYTVPRVRLEDNIVLFTGHDIEYVECGQ